MAIFEKLFIAPKNICEPRYRVDDAIYNAPIKWSAIVSFFTKDDRDPADTARRKDNYFLYIATEHRLICWVYRDQSEREDALFRLNKRLIDMAWNYGDA